MSEDLKDNLVEPSGLFSDVADTEQKPFPISAQLMVLSLLLLTIFGTGLMPRMLAFFDKTKDSQSATVPLIREEPEGDWSKNNSGEAFLNTDITATAAFVLDVNNQRVLFEKNPDQQLPLASITKLMTALVAHEIVTGESTVPISLSAILQEGESGLSDGNQFTLESLTDLTLISSSNDGAFAMAAAAGASLSQDNPATAFVEAMNIRAEELGLSQTYFRNPTGLDLSLTEAGAFGSARDIAFLMEYILKHYPVILEGTTDSQIAVTDNAGDYYQAENTNEIVDQIPGLIGSKTGYTALAGGNLAVAYDASLNRPIVVVVLNSTRNKRFDDVKQLVAAANEELK